MGRLGEAGTGVGAAEIAGFAGELLAAARFKDYCPNGLQVEGEGPIRRMVSGVTASETLIRAAIERDAQALLVHHGYFWRGEDPRLLGTRRRRIALLLEHGLHLFAYHLPLDVHPELGNNAQLARVLGWKVDGRFGEDGLGCWHELARPMSPAALAARVSRRLGQRALSVGNPPAVIRRVAWCTGAAQDLLEQAIAVGADAFVSGEISERTTHLAREAGVLYLSAGHHATERFGVQALGERLAAEFGFEHVFVDDPNPV
ncbi:MAG TPA: Nif3-like dinuclear metal center hexameric protein [Quisquiliibacterium sp.]|nr:Nif3-like dinuclear metal center hexameric protein [Quisquiliibacterium sp.]